VRPVEDDVRVTFQLRPEVDAAKLTELLRAELPEPDDVGHDRRQLFVYADSLAEAEQLRGQAVELIRREAALVQSPVIERWNPGAVCWQDPMLPTKRPALTPGSRLDPDKLWCQLVVECGSSEDRAQLFKDVGGEGYAVVPVSKHQFNVGLESEIDARDLGARLAGQVPFLTWRVERLGRFRRWLFISRVYGNYGGGGGGGG
jgi:hypothetical protein